MASLNGVEIKSIKSFNGVEGPTYEGTVYLNGTKLGFWTQDGNGGEDRFSFPVSHLSKPFLKSKSVSNSEYYYLESFMWDLLELTLLEKNYKTFVKRGYPVVLSVIITDMGMCTLKGFPSLSAMTNEKKQNFVDSVRAETKCNSVITTHVYSSLNDFILEVGTEAGFAALSIETEKAEKQSIARNIADSKKQELESEKLLNNTRFTSSNSDGPTITITDKETGKSVLVPIFAYKEVLKSLVHLFC